MKRITFLFFALLMSALSWQGMAQAGNTCGTPLVITGLPFLTTDNTSNYGDDYGPSDRPTLALGAVGNPSASYLNGDDVVYSYTPTANGAIDISVTNHGTWAGVFVFTGCPFASTVGGHTNSSGTLPLEVNALPVQANVTYYIVISTYASPQSTPYTLSVKEEGAFDCPALEANVGDACDDGNPNTVYDTVNADCECEGIPTAANDEACTATALACGDTITQSLIGATESLDDSCFGTGTADVWFTFTTDGSQIMTVAETSSFDAIVHLFKGACEGLVEAGACKDSPENYTVTEAGTYYFRVRPYSSASNEGTITVSLTCVDYDCPGLRANIGDACDDGNPNTVGDKITADCECVGIVPAPGTDCIAAISLDCNAEPMTFSSVGSTAIAPSGCTIGKNGLWFSFVGTGADITINSTASFDHKMSMQKGLCGELDWIACKDGSTGAETYTITDSVLNETYYVYVAHYSSTSTTTGNITIGIECAVVPECTLPTLTLAAQDSLGDPIVCLNAGGEYYVLATLTGGDGNTSYNVSANGGGPVEVNAEDSVILGPYTVGTNVNVTAVGAQDGDCSVTTSLNSPAFCPPTNDNCAGAIALICNAEPITFSSAGSTALAPAGCTIGKNGIWFSFVGTGADITINSTASFDHKMSMQTGSSCGELTWIACKDGSTGAETYTIADSVLDQMYYVYIAQWSSTSTVTGTITISIECAVVPTCPEPSNLAVGAVTDSSAEISWTEGGNATAWDIEYGPRNFAQGVGTTIPGVETNNSYILTGLAHSSQYDVYVRAACGLEDESLWIGPVSFTTLCVSTTVPYVMDFDTASVPNLPFCTSLENAGNGNDWETAAFSSAGFSGNVLRYKWNTSNAGNAWFYTQGIELEAGTTYQISYRYGNNTTSYAESMKVAYGLSPESSAMTNPLADYPVIQQSGSTVEELTFMVPANGTYYFGFNAYSDANLFYLYLDDISIIEAPSTGYVYENGNWTPSDPSGAATDSDNITVINGTTSLTGITGVNNLTVMSGATLNIEGVLNLYGDLTIDGELIFTSTSTGTGELGFVSATSTITGEATVHNYMSNNRSYRMVTSAVNTMSYIHTNWQENATSNSDNPAPGFGTHITGSTIDGNNGFDGTQLGNPSMFTVDVANQAFVPVSNTNLTPLEAGKPYLLFVRGDRSIDLGSNTSAGETVLRATGSLHTGVDSRTYNMVADNHIVMVGNPYQSAVDINSVIANSTNINPAHYYVYDPNMATYGAYVTVNLPTGANTSNSDANQYLQPGQGSQLSTNTMGAATVVFNETDKAPGNFTNTSATGNALSGNDMLTVQLFTAENFNNGGPTHDSFGIIFGDGLDNGLTRADAVKPMNLYENFGRDHNGTYLSIERREMPQPAEVYPLYSSGYNYSDYTLKMNIDGLEDTFLYLDDHFTGTSTLIEGETVYSFGIDANDPLSIATDRFSIRTEQRLGVDNNGLLSGVRLFPNPLSDNTFYINAPKLNGKQIAVSISDLSGRQIFENMLDCRANTVTVSVNDNLASGVYLVTLRHGGEESTYRLVKK